MERPLKVSDLMLANSTEWDLQKIDNILPFHKHEVLQIKPSICSAPDEVIPSLPLTGVGPGTLPASISWNLWISWNQLTFQKLDFTPEETLLKAIREAREWTLPQDQPPKPQSNPTRIAQDPTLDPIRTYMYIDDAGSSSSHSVTDTFVVSPLMAENLALQHAINSAVHRGITSLLILSDSQILIKLVNSKGRHLEIATLLNDISLISTLFNSVRFKFIPRLDNIRADSVAKHALLMYQT
ncbi:hypothetical protein F2Q69_00033321 [Brassica cretica]|uniref:RNase H type-1 domain-containing protein n=1 Tax=Brassica cretica TaxID=69181 RepID=A0A8S9SGL4_BRACR|nr:hypothetical protein F2Q69_00033321 [Brassica cretica]